eukprot:scaffold83523_cov60-Phaeocystis_antarctica.AAC.4
MLRQPRAPGSHLSTPSASGRRQRRGNANTCTNFAGGRPRGRAPTGRVCHILSRVDNTIDWRLLRGTDNNDDCARLLRARARSEVSSCGSADLLVALALELEVLDELRVLALLVDQLGVVLLQRLLRRVRRVAGG